MQQDVQVIHKQSLQSNKELRTANIERRNDKCIPEPPSPCKNITVWVVLPEPFKTVGELADFVVALAEPN